MSGNLWSPGGISRGFLSTGEAAAWPSPTPPSTTGTPPAPTITAWISSPRIAGASPWPPPTSPPMVHFYLPPPFVLSKFAVPQMPLLPTFLLRSFVMAFLISPFADADDEGSLVFPMCPGRLWFRFPFPGTDYENSTSNQTVNSDYDIKAQEKRCRLCWCKHVWKRCV